MKGLFGTYLMCLLAAIACAQSVPVATPLNVDCTIKPNEPKTCYIETPIFLLPGATITFGQIYENVTRFELKAFSNFNRIPSTLWAAFPNLDALVLANHYSSINVLSAVDFLKAPALEVLNLQGNDLITIPSRAFELVSTLKELDLSENFISEVQAFAFNGLDQLEQLDLSHNRLSLVNASTFFGLNNLLKLDLSHNKIKLIDDGSFFNMPELIYLNLNTNDVKLLPDTLFGSMPQLGYIDFGSNKLAHIGASLYSLQELQVLNLTSNKKIDDINLPELAKLPKLEQLWLSNSGFQFPTAVAAPSSPVAILNEFTPPSESPLKNLYLSKNHLINPDILKQLAIFPSLEVLDLDTNKFVYIDNLESFTTSFPHLRQIYLGENKLNCVWLEKAIPMFEKANVSVYTIKKTKSWTGTTVYERKLIDIEDCFDFTKIYTNIVAWLDKFGQPV